MAYLQVFERLILHELELSPTKCGFVMRLVALNPLIDR